MLIYDFEGLVINTGQLAFVTTPDATLPNTNFLKPDLP
jgi:hypothetical protein